MPIISDGKNWSIDKSLKINNFARSQIDASVEELRNERDMFNSLVF